MALLSPTGGQIALRLLVLEVELRVMGKQSEIMFDHPGRARPFAERRSSADLATTPQAFEISRRGTLADFVAERDWTGPTVDGKLDDGSDLIQSDHAGGGFTVDDELNYHRHVTAELQ